MSGFISKVRDVVTLTTEHVLGVGHQRCVRCQTATPRPSQEALRTHLQAKPHEHYIWPFSDWWPDDWIRITDSTGAEHYMCGSCADEMLRLAKVSW